jgi:hypothetical protein
MLETVEDVILIQVITKDLYQKSVKTVNSAFSDGSFQDECRYD